jgi:2-dehydro-3-deoxyphosphogluconate aldolase/(4S)-4-hydroxy-2-oxoglutarate aldolase
VLDHLLAAATSEAVVGVGTVLTADQARSAVDVGAKFLVTPGIRASVAEVATDSGIPVIMGALTPTEVLVALDLGPRLKIFYDFRRIIPRQHQMLVLCGPETHLFAIIWS